MELLTLTGMVKKPIPRQRRVVPTNPGKLYIEEHMVSHGWDRSDLAERMNTTEASISRWINDRRGVNNRRQAQLEAVFKLSPGGLRRPPSEAPEAALLAGLTDEKKRQALNFIEYLRKEPE